MSAAGLVQPLAEKYLTGSKSVASSNAVARQCEGGQTMHSAMSLRKDEGMGVERMIPEGKTRRVLEGWWHNVQTMLCEELSMWPPLWFFVLASRLGHVMRNARPQTFVDPNNPFAAFFAGIELVRLNADFLQLPPARSRRTWLKSLAPWTGATPSPERWSGRPSSSPSRPIASLWASSPRALANKADSTNKSG